MALIQCIECGGELSERAKVCPKCGAPRKARKSETTLPLGVSILRIIRRRKYALFGPPALSVLLILLMWKTIPDKYCATALVKRKDLALTSTTAGTMMVQDNGSKDLAPTNAAAGAMTVQENGLVSVGTMRAEILTWTNLDRVIKQLGLDVDLKTAADWQKEYERLKYSIWIRTVAQGRGMDLIEIAVMDKNPSFCQKIANQIADNYVEESLVNSRDDTQRAIDHFKAHCEENLAIVRKTNLELDKYTQEHGTELPEVKKQILAALQGLRTAESTRLISLAAAQGGLAEVQSQSEEAEKTGKPAEAGPVYEELFTARNKAVQTIKEHEAALADIRAQIKANEDSIRKVVAEEKQYADIQRQHDEAQAAYEQFHPSLLNLQNLSRVQSEPNGAPVEIVQRALEPVEPYRGYRAPFAFACLLGGLAVGLVLTTLQELLGWLFSNH